MGQKQGDPDVFALAKSVGQGQEGSRREEETSKISIGRNGQTDGCPSQQTADAVNSIQTDLDEDQQADQADTRGRKPATDEVKTLQVTADH